MDERKKPLNLAEKFICQQMRLWPTLYPDADSFLNQHVMGGSEWLSYHEEPTFGPEEDCRPALETDLTPEMVAELLDKDAEGRNAHDFVDRHSRLANLLYQAVGPKAANTVMRRVLKYGGSTGW